jgi:hypothetical protein
MLLAQVDMCAKIWTLVYTSYNKKANSKWITDLNVKPQTIKPAEENIGENLCDLGLGKNFLRFKKYKLRLVEWCK